MSLTPEQPDVMPFGRHAGLDYDALVIEDPRYARWIVEQPWLDPTIANKLRAAIAEDHNSTLKEANHV